MADSKDRCSGGCHPPPALQRLGDVEYPEGWLHADEAGGLLLSPVPLESTGLAEVVLALGFDRVDKRA